MKKLINLTLLLSVILILPIQAQDYLSQINSQLMKKVDEKTLLQDDVGTFSITSQHISNTSKVHHIYFRQSLDHLEIYGTESSIHILQNGDVFKTHINFVGDKENKTKGAKSPGMSAAQAVTMVAAQLGYTITEPIIEKSKRPGFSQETTLSRGGISLSDIPARLMYHRLDDNTLVLVWDISIEYVSKTEWYSVRANATTGEIIDKVSWSAHCSIEHTHDVAENQINNIYFDECNENLHENSSYSSVPAIMTGSYNVFAMPLESPYYGSRTLVTNGVNTTASPFGWHDTNGVPGPEYTVTRGNNVNAYEDGDNPGFQPNGGAGLVFDFPFNPVYTVGDQSEAASITNLFYWNNITHDLIYLYGFNEASGNFQENNYGNGGLGNDWVRAEGQDGSGTCNANFFTPPDGQLPRMQMYICGTQDGDFDNVVIVHEYAHGITNRLTGGAALANCLNNQEQMGEGWSDWYGLIMTMRPSDQAEDPRTVGTYLLGQGPGGSGVRVYPYSTDMAINPHTYDAIKTAAVPHGVGSVWAAMLWEMTWGLIDAHGFDTDFYYGTGGNNIALALVTEALKLQPCSPGFVDGRDAILAADIALYGGANHCIIWDAFAKRGLGINANQGSSNSRSDGIEDFSTPTGPATLNLITEVCENVGILTNMGGGSPFGGVYSGPGVTDNGNGSTFTFDPAVAGIGVHTITYAVPDTDCSTASSAEDTIEVLESLIIICPDEITVQAEPGTCGAIVHYTEPSATSGCSGDFIETFDSVITPALPAGWSFTQDIGGTIIWETTSSSSASAPNSVFANNPSTVNLSTLYSPAIEITSSAAQLIFNNRYLTETSFDGMVLEYRLNGGGWTDILNGGGTFASGGYNNTLSSNFSNPLGGRQAWSGNSGGFIETIVNLDASINGQTIEFRWRMGTDSSVASTGVWLDDIQIVGTNINEPTITQTGGLPSGSVFPVGTTTNTFEIEDAAGNIEICSFDVLVEDSEDPVLVCPENQVVEVNEGNYILPNYVSMALVTATDNCTNPLSITQDPPAGTSVGIGDHTINFYTEDASENSDSCSFVLTVNQSDGFEGCGLGYWRSGNNWCSTYSQNNHFLTVFGITNSRGLNANLTLMQSLNLNGGGYNNLARQATSALLNACNVNVNYIYTEQEVIDMVSSVFNNPSNNNGNANNLANDLKSYNETFCPLNNAPKSIHLDSTSFSVYPNPVSGKGIWLDLLLANNDDHFYVYLYDATGKLLSQQQFIYDQQTRTYFWDLDFGSFSEGVYFLKLMSGSVSEHKTLLLQR